MFLNIIVVSDLGSVTVSGYCVLVPADNLRDLRVEECADIALLIDNSEDFAVDTNDAADSGSTTKC